MESLRAFISKAAACEIGLPRVPSSDRRLFIIAAPHFKDPPQHQPPAASVHKERAAATIMAESNDEAVAISAKPIGRESLPSAHRWSPVNIFSEESTQDADQLAFAYNSDNDDDLELIEFELKARSVTATSTRLHDGLCERNIESPMSDLAMHISNAILSDATANQAASKYQSLNIVACMRMACFVMDTV